MSVCTCVSGCISVVCMVLCHPVEQGRSLACCSAYLGIVNIVCIAYKTFHRYYYVQQTGVNKNEV